MNAYLFSLLTLSLAVMTLGVLLPSSGRSGAGRYAGLLISLLLIACLISPVKTLLEGLLSIADGEIGVTSPSQNDREELQKELQDALDESSQTYFAGMLSMAIEREFSIPAGEVEAVILWNEAGSAPASVTLLLSGSAVWKNPAPMEAYVSELLNCPCTSAVKSF